MQCALNYSGTSFLSTEIKITQFPNGFRLKSASYQLASGQLHFQTTYNGCVSLVPSGTRIAKIVMIRITGL